MTIKVLVELACELVQHELDFIGKPSSGSLRILFDLVLSDSHTHSTTLGSLSLLARSYLTLYCHEFEQCLWGEICSEGRTYRGLRYAVLLLQVIELSSILDEQLTNPQH